MSQPKVGDTVYIIGTIKDYHVSFNGRNIAKIVTSRSNLTDNFCIYADQIALVEPPEEVTECVDL